MADLNILSGRNGANFRRLANQFGVLVDEVEQQPQQQYSQSDATGGSGDEGGPLIVKIRGEKKRVADCYAELKHEVCEEVVRVVSESDGRGFEYRRGHFLSPFSFLGAFESYCPSNNNPHQSLSMDSVDALGIALELNSPNT